MITIHSQKVRLFLMLLIVWACSHAILGAQDGEYNRDDVNAFDRSLLLGILDFISILLFVIPLFANREGGKIETVNLLQFRNQHSYIKNMFIALIASSSLFGVIELLFQSVQEAWKRKLELIVSGIFSCVGVMILIVTKQPYPSIFLFTLFVIKVVVALNTQR